MHGSLWYPKWWCEFCGGRECGQLARGLSVRVRRYGRLRKQFDEQMLNTRQLRELRSCELVAMDMGRLWKSEATEDVSHFLTVYGSILLIEK